MSLSPYEIALIAGGFTIIGAILGSWITYRFALHLQTIAEFNKAAAIFRSAFIEVQRLLCENKSFDITAPGGTRVKTIIEKYVVEHERAMLNFRPYVTRGELNDFNKAWMDYYGQENKYAECLTEYAPVQVTPSVDDPKHEEKTRELVLSRIEKLLKFASFK